MRFLLTVPLIVAASLSGCFGGGGGGTTDDPLDVDVDVQPTATTGIIRGVVVDSAIRPIAGVSISVPVPQGAPKTALSESGAFGFEGLEPATYFLSVTKLGYLSAQQSVEVVAGEADPPIVKVVLEADRNFVWK